MRSTASRNLRENSSSDSADSTPGHKRAAPAISPAALDEVPGFKTTSSEGGKGASFNSASAEPMSGKARRNRSSAASLSTIRTAWMRGSAVSREESDCASVPGWSERTTAAGSTAS